MGLPLSTDASTDVSTATEPLQAEAQLKEQTEVLETIIRTGRLLSAELDQQKLVQAVTDAATELCGAQFGAFFYNVYDEQGDAYMLYTLSGVPREAFAQFRACRAPRTCSGRPSGARGDPRRRRHRKTRDTGPVAPHHGMPPGHLPVRSYLAVSVISRSGEVMGGLFFGHSEDRRLHRAARADRRGSPPRPRSRSTTPGCIEGAKRAPRSAKLSSRASGPRAPRPSAPAG